MAYAAMPYLVFDFECFESAHQPTGVFMALKSLPIRRLRIHIDQCLF